jgi:hypothetical protein
MKVKTRQTIQKEITKFKAKLADKLIEVDPEEYWDNHNSEEIFGLYMELIEEYVN